MKFPRASGILLHPTSLPGRFGIGDLGPEAYRFIDFLADTGQSLWQILPLGPPGYENSPYMCFSAFAGNPLLISLEKLAQEKLLAAADLQDPHSFPKHRVDYGKVLRFKMPLLVKSFQNFKKRLPGGKTEEFFPFCQQNAFWLEDYSLFMALKTAFGGKVWMDWGEGLSHRDPQALADWRSRLSEEVLFRKYLQYVFFKQWQSLKRHAHERGIRVIGDIPIYVAHDSAEVWGNRELFYLDEGGMPQVVAGVPPDYFSATGQRWGNPLYRWDLMAQSGFHWWIERFRATYALVDILRIDHFRGFEAYWEIPATEATAVNGAWVKGPGTPFFQKITAALGNLRVIAEDLGVITPEVDELREQFGFPGMRVLQMAFGKDPKASEYRPHHHVENCVAYTGTHDHNTTVGWFTSPPGSQKTTQTPEEVGEERKFARQYLGTDGREIHWDLIRLALGSVARMSLFPLQDVLGLGSEARMNLPGTASGNWEWRFTADRLTHPVRKKLRELTKTYERNP